MHGGEGARAFPAHCQRSRIEWHERYWMSVRPARACTCSLYAGRMLISEFFSCLLICAAAAARDGARATQT
eukprot:409323-Pleurochrysis_carterae.AAC.2